MDVVLIKFKWQLVFVNLHGIFIIWKTPDKYIDHFWKVLALLKEFGVSLNVEDAKLSRMALPTSTMQYPPERL